jgi:NAD(P)-dependent dehydrogenase (short-subunit alcohol dehydrogenase family)
VFQTNYLGHAHLTQRLLSLLKATADTMGGHSVRIVSVSSGAHTRAGMGCNLEEINAAAAHSIVIGGSYGQSKLAQIMWTKELQRRLDDDTRSSGNDIRCVAVTPGFARTSIVGPAGLKAWQRAAMCLLWPFLLLVSRSDQQGAQVILMACLGDDVKGGGYYSNCLEKPTQGRGGISNSPEACSALWDLTVELLAPATGQQ